MAVQAGQRVGEYVLDAKIGGGTFGEVWRARHHVWSDQLVAIKIPTDPQYLRNLKGEGAAIHGLSHPNIVRAIGFDPYAEVPYLAMEYVPGSSLRPLIEKKSLLIPQAVSVMRQVLTGLKYAHEHGVIHRDIKPENILIHERAFADGYDVEGVVKITDFGLGKAANNAMGSIAYSASLNTPAAKEIAGTLEYMAPEQRTGSEPQSKSDLYACGVMLYEMLTGERPAGTDVPSDLNKSAPAYLDEAFRRSYARLDKRFSSADEFLAVLPPVAKMVMPPPLPRPSVTVRTTSDRTNGGQSQCPQCRQQVDAADQFCMHCGVQLVAEVRRCPKCGAFPELTDRYCIFCGESLAQRPVMA
jgi:serine/threonine protein kinase